MFLWAPACGSQIVITIQLQLPPHYAATTATTTLHHATPRHTTFSSCGWINHCNHSKKNNSLQPPSGPSMDSLCHPCITTTHLSYSCLTLKLPPPPCTVLLLVVVVLAAQLELKLLLILLKL